MRLLQVENTDFSMFITLAGIVMDVSPVQPENARLPMVVTLLPIVTDVSLLQDKNPFSLMDVTWSGIVYDPVLSLGKRINVALSLLKSTPPTSDYD